MNGSPGIAGDPSSIPAARALRVLFVESSRGTIGGSGVSLLQILRHVDRRRVDPHVLLFERGLLHDQLQALGCEVIVWDDARTLDDDAQARSAAAALGRAGVGRGRLRAALSGSLRLLSEDFPQALRFETLVRDRAADLVHANDRIRSNAFAIYGAWLARRPIAVSERLLYPYAWTDRFASRRVGLMICVSEAVRRSVRAQGGSPRRLEVLHDPVPLPLLDGRHGDSHPGRVSFFGRLVPWKGAHVFVRACALVAAQDPEARFMVVGGPAPETGDYAEGLRTLAASHGLEDRLTFTGLLPDISQVMRQSAVVVHASTTPEPFGRVLIEAMAYGVPVIATRMGGPLEILVEGETGLFVEPESAEDLARAIRWILDHPDRGRAMGARGREVARARYDPHDYVRALLSWYETLLSTPWSTG